MNERKINYVVLASKVLAVCVVSKYDWTAYVDAVPGQNHENEYLAVARMGCKLPLEVAMLLFPTLDKEKWRN